MRVELRGWVSVDLDGEQLFEGEALPVRFVNDVDDDQIDLRDEAVKLRFSVPVELDVADDEWLRAVAEVMVRHLSSELEGEGRG